MKKLTLLAVLALSSTSILSGCTEACEDGCEQQHDAVACLETRSEAECEQVTQDLLTCVQACNE